MGRGMGGDMGPGMFGRAIHALDLSDAQHEKFADIRERQMRRDIQARADLQIARLDLRKAMRSEKPEAGAIDSQIDRVAKLRADMAKTRVASLLEARALLTPDQLKKLHDLRMRPPGAGMPGVPGMGRGRGMGPGGMGGNGMGRGGRAVHVRVERDSLRSQ
jgi:Spy/CpxP family protein refolding chaperone